jgi:hypothetical protein
VKAAREDGITVESGADAELGLRAWLAQQDGTGRTAAAFDTRIARSSMLTGAASRGIFHRLRRAGFDLLAAPESFFVEDSEGPLAVGELERALEWGIALSWKLRYRSTLASASAPRAAAQGM